MKRSSLFLVLASAVALLVLTIPAAGNSAPPGNDNFANATQIASLPFSNVVGISEATTEPGEPLESWYQGRTVWYSFTPSQDVVVRADLGGSDYVVAFMSIYRASSAGFGGLTKIAGGSYGSPFTFTATAGTTYYVQGGDGYGVWGWTNTVGINLQAVLPPSNDNFSDAIAFTTVPFSDSRDLTAATVETGEPMSCGASFTQSIWYAFTPATSGSYGAFGASNVAVYTGSALGTLTNVACADWPGLYFHADAGTTYYLQSWGGGVSVDVIPPPAADFTYSPGDPSTFDQVSFDYWNGGYWDPTVTGYSWTFGDGSTATGSPAPHRFAKDGDYAVTMTVDARGGRSNTATKTVQVRTHDVTMLSLTAPGKGQVGKRGVVTVGIGNTRYPETVQVDLYRVTPQGDVLVGTSIQTVGVMKPKKTVVFSFNYVFTSEDLLNGKVTFKAVATIQGARDALGFDNTATSTPTLVTK